MSGNKQVVFSLIVAVIIICFMAFMSEQPGYTLDAAEFLAALPKQDAEYRVQGVVRAADRDGAYHLCSEDKCLTFVWDAAQTAQPPVDQKIVVFGRWQQNILNATKFITPCHDDVR